jgi:hypothetical protein
MLYAAIVCSDAESLFGGELSSMQSIHGLSGGIQKMCNCMFLRKLIVGAAFVLPVSIVLVSTTTRVEAQAISGDLVGVVTDPTGAVIPGIKVDVANIATGVKFSSITNSNGEYRFTNLQIGHYSIQASGNGMAGGYKDVEVQLNHTASANIAAVAAGNATTVEVNTAATVIDTTTSQLQNTFESKQVQDLPTSSQGLGVVNLSLLSAGAASSGGIGEGTGPSISGQRPTNNNFTVEGVDNNNKSVPAPVINIPNDAVQNFTVLQNQFSPEFGHSSGGQFNTVIDSGTNKVHGRVYEYFENRNMNAIDASNRLAGFTQNPRYDNNRFGGQVGGPILKNKIFFFVNQQYNPIGQTKSAYSCAPTAAGYTFLATQPGVSALNLGLMQQYLGSAPTAGGSSCPSTGAFASTTYQEGQVNYSGPQFSNTYTTLNSVDVNFSQNDQLRVRYIYARTAAQDTSALNPVFWVASPTRQHLFTLSEYHTFTPRVLNEFRLGYNRSASATPASSVPFPTATEFPNIDINDLGAQIGGDYSAPSSGVQNTYQATDNVTWIRGNHTFTFGGEARKYIAPTDAPNRLTGDYEWTTITTFLSDVVPDYFGERSGGDNPYPGDQTAFYGYANDDWRVTPNLTINAGLRYEFTSVPAGERQQALNVLASVPGLISFTAPQPQRKNFAPRIGFAYSPGTAGTTSIRGGFGIAYDVLYDNLGRAYRPPQLGALCDVMTASNAVCPYSATAFLANGGLPGVTGPGFVTYPTVTAQRQATAFYIPNQTLPYSENWSLGIQHVFARKYTAEVRYVGTRGIHLTLQTYQNRISPVTSAAHLPTYSTAQSQAQLDALTTTLASLQTPSASFIPAYYDAGFTQTLTGLQPYGASNYNGLQTQFNRSFDHGLQFQAAWTYSKALDNSTADVSSTTLTPRRPQDTQNIQADYSTSALDHRHRVTIETIYDIPFFKTNSNWFEKNLIGNWEIAPIYTFQSSQYFTPQSGVDSNLNGDSAPDRTIRNPNGVRGTGSAVVPLMNSAKQIVAYQAVNPNAEYIEAGLGAVATDSRNSYPLPHINNFDFTALKRVTIWGERVFEFQAQAFNVLNHSQYIAGSINTVDSIGTFTSAQTRFVDAGNAAFNNPKLAFSNNARTLQLVAKFIF